MSNEAHFLDFIKNINEDAAQISKKMEELIFEDAASSIVKARLFAESVLNKVYLNEDIEVPYNFSMFEKITYLVREGYIKRDLQKAFDTIRITGNKAAHDAQFNDITEAFKLHRVMHDIAVWFYEVYSLEKLRLPAYNPPKPPPKNNANDLQELVRRQVLELLGQSSIGGNEKTVLSENEEVDKDTSEDLEQNTLFQKNLPKGKSYLLRELRRLQDSSQEAVENANAFSRFKKYLHVERKIQKDLEGILLQNNNSGRSSLILLCGSVGDGKSHLLAYLNENRPDLIKDYHIFNDATESFSPTKNAMETLEEILQDFSDQRIDQSNKKVILAINMGVLHNFITRDHKGITFDRLNEFVANSDLFSQNITTSYSEDTYSLISFGDYHSYELTSSGPKSSFFLTLVERIFSKSEGNPFFLAYKEDAANNIRTMIHDNFEFMQEDFVQKQIVNEIIQTLVKNKLVISARAFLNFLADIVIPDQVNAIGLMTEFERLEQSVPSLLFRRKERSPILKVLSELDPIHLRSSYIDKLIIELNTLSEWESIVEHYNKSAISKTWLKPFIQQEELGDYSFDLFSETLIRVAYLTNEDFSQKIEDHTYKAYVLNLFYINSGERSKIKEFYEDVKSALFKWKGSPQRGYIYLNKPIDKFRLAQSLNLKPSIDHLKFNTNDVLESFKATILLGYNNTYLEIDYPLYRLLLRVKEGYCPSKKDEEDAIKFVEFIDKVMNFGDKKRELLVHFPNENKSYKLKRDDFGAFVFEKE
ncbi:MAG: DNA phosphorothioation-dependent restriction protein DptF [Anaerobacillus sp.]|uniref:DNA phosphorothioation-dependent restriction protein DptF n=1 Tax=Anaerobacillus sp. TaxID=1872506 RepID=UPI00391C0C73